MPSTGRDAFWGVSIHPPEYPQALAKRPSEHAGFERATTAESLPLRRTEEEGMVKYSIVDRSEANASFDYLRMELPVERFRQSRPEVF
ncbi:hypothetical protein [Rhizobium esperanzae]|uniref:Uncharacterized protein n=1 Tax=Rhizobium esperanzae TaxID=1967781 RepID=A0A7W6R1Z8_9HYPH|nr:hypothetical protein [Rhizobium esperanzae]MBB4235254.1 hypothetical protein [Rhizobium esperanzae]